MNIRKKFKRRPYPIWKSANYIFKSPLAIYAGGALHYIGKDGKIKHSNKTVAEVKKDTMSISEFKKRFYNSVIMKKIMKDH